jgi:hypothetical protein
MKQRIAQILPIFAVFFVSFVALAATMGVAALAHAGSTRVALIASSDGWKRVESSGLPIVRLALGGLLIVVDGAGAPDAMARLRAGSLFLLDASLIPGCEVPGSVTTEKVPDETAPVEKVRS